MKISLAQLNYIIGDFEGNSKKIIDKIIEAKNQGVSLIVFSELCICGYPPLDLLEHATFIDNCEKSLKQIAKHCDGIASIVGIPVLNKNEKGKNLYNAACFISEGQIKKTIKKSLLPTYDIFDEYRYFEPHNTFELFEYKGYKLAVTICEDLWYDQPLLTGLGKNKIYTINPIKELIKDKPHIIINIAASPFSYTQEKIKREIFTNNARKYKVPIVYVNQVGANTELIFDGYSLAINKQGTVVERLKSFEEDVGVIELNDLIESSESKEFIPIKSRIEKIHDALVLGIRDYFHKLNFKSAILGLSGGIDSAVTCVLAVKALGKENVRVLLLPSKYSSDHSVIDAVSLAKNLAIRYDIVNIEKIVNEFDEVLKPIFKDLPPGLAEENIQARIRGNLLMAVSNKYGHILLNTSNKSEAAVGYGTLYGDMSGGLSVLGDVYKTDVYELALFMNKENEIISQNTISKAPSAELKPDQKDTDSLPDYEILDKVLHNYIELRMSGKEIARLGLDKKLVQQIIRMVNTNEYKRFQTPPILRISSKAFGTGRRMPLVAKYW